MKEQLFELISKKQSSLSFSIKTSGTWNDLKSYVIWSIFALGDFKKAFDGAIFFISLCVYFCKRMNGMHSESFQGALHVGDEKTERGIEDSENAMTNLGLISLSMWIYSFSSEICQV